MFATSSPATALPLPATAPAAARALRIPRRPLKLAAASTLLLAGAYGVLSEQQYVSSSNAVVSAYVLDLRAPIAGTVTHLPLSPGAPVHAGDLLGHLDDPLADHQHLDNLRTLEDVAHSTAEADAAELAALAGQRNGLLARAALHASAVTDRLTLAVSEAESTLAAREAAAEETARELDRGRQLHDAGILPTADFDKLAAADSIARRQVAAQRTAVSSLRDQAGAAGRGLLAEPGINNDVAYSRQRADEVSIKLAETGQSLAAARAQARQAHAAVLGEAARSGGLRAADLRSPIDGQVWEIQAMDGERFGTGDQVISLIDCRRQFLLVEVPQERLPDIAVGHLARFRLSGESAERTGRVLAATGDPQKEVNHKVAAFPLQDPSEQLATVRVALGDGTDTIPCNVGRAARVLLPTQPSNAFSRFVRKSF